MLCCINDILRNFHTQNVLSLSIKWFSFRFAFFFSFFLARIEITFMVYSNVSTIVNESKNVRQTVIEQLTDNYLIPFNMRLFFLSVSEIHQMIAKCKSYSKHHWSVLYYKPVWMMFSLCGNSNCWKYMGSRNLEIVSDSNHTMLLFFFERCASYFIFRFFHSVICNIAASSTKTNFWDHFQIRFAIVKSHHNNVQRFHQNETKQK